MSLEDFMKEEEDAPVMKERKLDIPEEIEWIQDDKLRAGVEHMLNLYSLYLEMPASLSGKYHLGDTLISHSVRAMHFARLMCKEFAIEGLARDEVMAATMIHDIGKCKIVTKKYSKGRYLYDSPTGKWWMSGGTKLWEHPFVGKDMVMLEIRFPMESRVRIAGMVEKHMSHWCKEPIMPETLQERIVALSDFLAAGKEVKIAPLDFEVRP